MKVIGGRGRKTTTPTHCGRLCDGPSTPAYGGFTALDADLGGRTEATTTPVHLSQDVIVFIDSQRVAVTDWKRLEYADRQRLTNPPIVTWPKARDSVNSVYSFSSQDVVCCPCFMDVGTDFWFLVRQALLSLLSLLSGNCCFHFAERAPYIIT